METGRELRSADVERAIPVGPGRLRRVPAGAGAFATGIRRRLKGAEPDGPAAYASVDSTPVAYSIPRSVWTAPTFLAIFLLAATGLVVIRPVAMAVQTAMFGDELMSRTHVMPHVLRAFFIAIFIAYAAMAAGPARQRIRLSGIVAGGFLVMSFGIEALALILAASAFAEPVLWLSDLLIFYAGVGLLSLGILRTCQLPAATAVPIGVQRSHRFTFVLLTTVPIAAAVAMLATAAVPGVIEQLRDVALLGSMLPGVFLFWFVLWGQWVGISLFEILRRPTGAGQHASVAFLVPALNEADGITETIKGLDRAALGHAGPTRIYVVDNGSSDGTPGIAQAAIKECSAASGIVLSCPKAGKAHALNLGLEHVVEEFVIRVDADTVVDDDVIDRALAYFDDPRVGAVGGIMLPRSSSSRFASVRTIEVLFKISFIRVAQNAVDTVMVVPGFFAAYRRDVLELLGGFVTGMNGEDTDMTIRIGRAGYRIITDPRIRVRSEVPPSLRHLREQRLRWGRSNYHVIARNLPAMDWRLGPRGFWTMPWAVVALVRAPLIVPFILFGLLLAVFAPNLYPRGLAPLAATIIGLELLVTVLILVINHRLDLVRHLPAYLAFLVLRWYFALESFLTLVVSSPARHTDRTAIPVGSDTSPTAIPVMTGTTVASRK